MHVYLCLGQSNMEGHVRVNPEFEPDVDSRFRVLQAVDCPNLGRVKGSGIKPLRPLYVATQV